MTVLKGEYLMSDDHNMRKQPTNSTFGKGPTPTLILQLLVINPCFRFIRKTLGHKEQEGNKTAKKLEKVHTTKTGQDIGDKRQYQSSRDTLSSSSQRYFSQLERKDVEGLIQKYQVDLAMWGYSPQKYLDFAI